MKAVLLFFILFCICTDNSFCQLHNTPVTRLTDGNFDRNPAFVISNSTYGSWRNYDIDFLVFERGNPLNTNSKICIAKMNYYGRTGNIAALSDSNYINRNPSISFIEGTYYNREIKYALVCWESNRNGSFDIYASSYLLNDGWSEPFILDSTEGNQSKPRVTCIDSINYAITFQSQNDIYYLRYNLLSGEITQRKNLTAIEAEYCSNPNIVCPSGGKIYIAYEKEISPGRNGIYYRTGNLQNMPDTGRLRDTVACTGNNKLSGFTFKPSSIYAVFESNRQGLNDIYMTELSETSPSQSGTVIHPSFYNYGYKGRDLAITDNVTNSVFSYYRQATSSVKYIIKLNLFGTYGDSLVYNVSNGSSFKGSSTVNNSIPLEGTPCHRFWFVFTKDTNLSLGSSLIYGAYLTNCLSDIHHSSFQTQSFKLFQNYPNPFNPVTIIKYTINRGQLSSTDGNAGMSSKVKLIVYDILGNEIATLVDERQSAGSYTVDFDGTNLTSGIYFYKLQTDIYEESKK